jgi:methionyl-tRNA formyltransferase
MNPRVVFFGNSEGVFSNHHFQALLEAPCQIAGVVDVPPARRTSTNARTAEGSGFVELAHARSIPVFQPESPNAPEFVEAMRALSPDLFVAVGYMNLLKAEVLAVPRVLAANFHASLLPAYRGKHPLFWALRKGERRVGLTVHVMGPGFDTGDTIYQVRLRTRPSDTVASVYDRVMAKSVPLIARLIADVEKGRVRWRPQPSHGASYYSSVREEDLRLDWSRRAEELGRWIRLSPGQCFRPIAGRKVFFLDAEAAPCRRSVPAGTVVEIGRSSVTVAAGRGALRIGKVRVDQGGERGAPEAFRELGLVEGKAV